MKSRYGIYSAIAIVALLSVVAYCFVARWDLTDDKRYSLGEATKTLLRDVDSASQDGEAIEVTVYLDGKLNAGFLRLRDAVEYLTEEMGVYTKVVYRRATAEEAEKLGLTPTMIHERAEGGRMAQTMVYPYAKVAYKGRYSVVPLLKSNRMLSGEENLNHSIESLEYGLAEAIESLTQERTQRIAFLEGHGELPEEEVYDVSVALSRYFQIDRGSLGSDATALDGYEAVVVADPQSAFSESDKYILDRYVQGGGRILWLVNGVRLSEQALSAAGFTPVIPLDLKLTDLFFRYGVRINPALVQDLQCLSIPVDVSADGLEPNYQPIPWPYAPLLLTSQASPITRNVAQINSLFASPIDIVGGEDGLTKTILLATSSNSRVIGTPAEVNLGVGEIDTDMYRLSYLPVGVSVEGQFPSLFAHRMRPEGIEETEAKTEGGKQSRQVWIAAGSVIRNEWQQGQALPAGYDRYSRMQFGNRELIVNAVLWLTDKGGLIGLRNKQLTLRLLNDKRAHDEGEKIQIISTVVPVIVLILVGGICFAARRVRYTRKK